MYVVRIAILSGGYPCSLMYMKSPTAYSASARFWGGREERGRERGREGEREGGIETARTPIPSSQLV